MSGATSLSVGTFGWFAEGSGSATPPAPAPSAHLSSVASGTFDVTVDSVSGDAGTRIYLQTRLYASADSWETQDSGVAAVDLILTATGLSSAQLEWRVIEGPDESTFADGSHGFVTPVDPETVQVQWYMKQTAVLWRLSSSVDSDGLPLWDSPIEIRCRWEEVQLVQGLGEPLRFQVTALLDRDVKDGDYLMLGTISSSTPDDPRDDLSWEVLQFDLVPDVKAKKFLRTAQAAPSPLKLLQQRGRGTEPVTYKKLSTAMVSEGGVLSESFTDVEVLSAARSNLQVDDLQGGRFKSSDLVWDISKRYLPAEPSMKGDHLIDGEGRRWDVLSFSENRLLRGWWRIVTRRAKT